MVGENFEIKHFRMAKNDTFKVFFKYLFPFKYIQVSRATIQVQPNFPPKSSIFQVLKKMQVYSSISSM